MKSLIASQKSFQEPFVWLQGTKDYEIYDKCEKIKIQITFTKDYKIIYRRGEIILRVEKVKQFFKNPELMTNLEQIRHLDWQGEYGIGETKCGKWQIKWNGKILKDVGGYYENGQKQGLWQELKKNYWNQAQVYEIGEYFNDYRKGGWDYIYQNNKIYGGQYNEQGQKNAKWIDLSDSFQCFSQIIYNGEYNFKGQKIGLWNIMYCKDDEKEYKQIGGGLYDAKEKEFQKKIGRWVELSDYFMDSSQITYNGEYNRQGIKVGRWDIMYKEEDEDEFKLIGGGSYHEQERDSFSVKFGKWIEIGDNWWKTFTGEYNGEGKKVGKWVEKNLKKIK
ncbi:unnamed protein product [Paramecium sonneborni]|uniref:MORN repeat protein n=1 Tax=Paramecium sonneborni TaxID=65129 RepID=A0A8S1MMS5_9CILI|nr:unnamed protein product [Paramecium sonneborni]